MTKLQKDGQSTEQDKASPEVDRDSLTDAILWSDCPEDLYLRRILKDRKTNAGGASGGSGGSLMGDSTVDDILEGHHAEGQATATNTQLVVDRAEKGNVRKWTDFAPIAASIETGEEGGVQPALKQEAQATGRELTAPALESHSDSSSPPQQSVFQTASCSLAPPSLPSRRDSQTYDSSIRVNLRPRILAFEGEIPSAAHLPEAYAIPEVVDIEVKADELNEKGVVSTLTGDTGMHRIQPQIDYSQWWIPADDVTYAKLYDEEMGEFPPICPRGFKRKSRRRVKKPPATPTTQASNTVSGEAAGRNINGHCHSNRCWCGNLCQRASDDKVFQFLLKIAVILFVVMLILAIMASYEAGLFGGKSGPDENQPDWSVPAGGFPASEPTPDVGGSPPTSSPVDGNEPLQPPTVAPSVNRPGPDTTTSPTRAPYDMISVNEYERVVGILSEASPRSLESLGEQSSPQLLSLQRIVDSLLSSPDAAMWPDERILQRWVLGVFYFSTRGSNWVQNDGWMTDDDECLWYTTSSIPNSCDSQGRIKRLELRGNQLDGTIPFELSLLSNSLERFYLNSNMNIRGTLPTELGKLSKLERLMLTVNKITGTIPTELGNLRSLERLSLGRNSFSGSLPSQLSTMEALRVFDGAKNAITGSIPSEFGNLTSLEVLSLTSNQVSSTVPATMGKLNTLEGLKLGSNQLTGSIPENLCELREGSLGTLIVDCAEVVCSCCDGCR